MYVCGFQMVCVCLRIVLCVIVGCVYGCVWFVFDVCIICVCVIVFCCSICVFLVNTMCVCCMSLYALHYCTMCVYDMCMVVPYV